MTAIKFPPYLRKGDRIGIMCPAGYMARKNVQSCIDELTARGFKVEIGKTVGSASKNYFSGSDKQRCDELQKMLDDTSINAILFARGGYGCSRIIDLLNFKKFIKNPKWLIGFSDITVIHNHILQNFNIASLHSSMASAFAKEKRMKAAVESIFDALSGKAANYESAAHPLNKKGEATAPLIGGNLSILAHLIGTPSEPDTSGKILFLEDVGEYLYHIDRLLVQIKRSGKLDNIKGLVVGGFTEMKDTEKPFGKTVEEIIAEAVTKLKIPVAFGFPVSHGKKNVALKQGGTYSLKVTSKGCTLSEINKA